MMKFELLASGSKGNCCVIRSETSSIIIDCGSTKKYLTSCFDEIDFDYKQADALLITHTHRDHVSQLKIFNGIKTYSNQTLETINHQHVEPYDRFWVNDFNVMCIPLSHDCDITLGYIIDYRDERLVYITDTGYIKEEVKQYITNADYYIFESNHDIELLMQTNRPTFVKQRIIQDRGHLCNEDSAYALASIIGENTKEIVLAHISEEGNSRDLAVETLKETLYKTKFNVDDIKIEAAAQFEITFGGMQDEKSDNRHHFTFGELERLSYGQIK